MAREHAPAGQLLVQNILGLRLRGRLDMDALRETLNEVVRRHEALRTRFEV